jgi:hypothetical protein
MNLAASRGDSSKLERAKNLRKSSLNIIAIVINIFVCNSLGNRENLALALVETGGKDSAMARENETRILRGRLAVMQALWNHEREQILQTLGVEEINPRAWSTETLIEEIQDCIEGHKMLAAVAEQEPPTNDELTEDWLNDIPLFD